MHGACLGFEGLAVLLTCSCKGGHKEGGAQTPLARGCCGCRCAMVVVVVDQVLCGGSCGDIDAVVAADQVCCGGSRGDIDAAVAADQLCRGGGRCDIDAVVGKLRAVRSSTLRQSRLQPLSQEGHNRLPGRARTLVLAGTVPPLEICHVIS